LVAGKVKPEAFMAHRMNGQYILEGISGAMMYTLGGEWGAVHGGSGNGGGGSVLLSTCSAEAVCDVMG
jgi:hypothetical protein